MNPTEQGLEQFAEAMKQKMSIKRKQYGDSWLTCDIEFLRDRLAGEIKEYENAFTHREEMGELVDMANCCMMLYNRMAGFIPVLDTSSSPNGSEDKIQERIDEILEHRRNCPEWAKPNSRGCPDCHYGLVGQLERIREEEAHD